MPGDRRRSKKILDERKKVMYNIEKSTVAPRIRRPWTEYEYETRRLYPLGQSAFFVLEVVSMWIK